MAQDILGVFWVWPVVEWLGNSRIVSQEVWDLEILSEYFFLGVVQVLSPLHINSLVLQSLDSLVIPHSWILSVGIILD